MRAGRPVTLTALADRLHPEGAVAGWVPTEPRWRETPALEKVLDFTDVSILTAVGLSLGDLVRPSHALTRQIGQAAHERGVQAIKSPSATGVDEVLVLLPENLGGATVHVQLVEVWESSEDM
jgi:hypothetical protein